MRFIEYWKPIELRGFPVPRFLAFLRDHDPGFHKAFPLETERDFARLIAWWFHEGQREFPGVAGVPLPEATSAFLARDFELSGGVTLPSLLWGLWSVRDDLRAHFKIEQSAQEGLAFLAWWQKNGPQEYPRLHSVLSGHPSESREQGAEIATPAAVSGGITLVGYPFGTFGIGEDVRQLSRALDACQIPHDIVEPKIALGTANADPEVKDKTVSIGQYETVIFCMPPADLIIALARGAERWRGRRYIAYSQWEYTTILPSHRIFAHEMEDIWTISNYSKCVFEKETGREVRRVSNSVSLPPELMGHPGSRRQPPDPFAVLINFDFNSTLDRKNPFGAVRAFRQAFRGIPQARLIIKTINHLRHPASFQELLGVIGEDPQVRLITENLSRHDNLALLASADCYLSLHRAEGFGRNIAEAMLLGVPTVVTGYSGNMDFCSEQNSYLVSYRIIPYQTEDRDLGEWADPSETSAAERLLEVYRDPALAQKKAHQARSDIQAHFSTAAQAETVKRLLARFLA